MKNHFSITLLPEGRIVSAEEGQRLLTLLQTVGVAPSAPCGGNGTCGKCTVIVNGQSQLACRTPVDRDMTVQLPETTDVPILTQGTDVSVNTDPDIDGYLVAIDLGTTTMVCYMLDQNGSVIATASSRNPQRVYGADVISRIQYALAGNLNALSQCVREGLCSLIQDVCHQADISPNLVQRIALVANPCMQQLLLGISPENLSKVPFCPVLTKLEIVSAKTVLPICANAQFVIVPDLSGYVGADTIGCVLSTGMYQAEDITLMVDIGTNGEMVLGSKAQMVACSTAAGPALEGASICFGMCGSEGAIDHVDFVDGSFRVHVIGDVQASGICGSGLIDAVAVLLEQGLINKRGRILSDKQEYNGERAIYLTEQICLTQSDIRQVQLAKGAIAAGIELMAKYLEIELTDIQEVLLAGAFGSFIRPESACGIGLIPPVLLPRIHAIGNAAGSGAKLLVCNRRQQSLAETICQDTEFLELASLPEFQKCFGNHTNFA